MFRADIDVNERSLHSLTLRFHRTKLCRVQINRDFSASPIFTMRVDILSLPSPSLLNRYYRGQNLYICFPFSLAIPPPPAARSFTFLAGNTFEFVKFYYSRLCRRTEKETGEKCILVARGRLYEMDNRYFYSDRISVRIPIYLLKPG